MCFDKFIFFDFCKCQNREKLLRVHYRKSPRAPTAARFSPKTVFHQKGHWVFDIGHGVSDIGHGSGDPPGIPRGSPGDAPGGAGAGGPPGDFFEKLPTISTSAPELPHWIGVKKVGARVDQTSFLVYRIFLGRYPNQSFRIRSKILSRNRGGYYKNGDPGTQRMQKP